MLSMRSIQVTRLIFLTLIIYGYYDYIFPKMVVKEVLTQEGSPSDTLSSGLLFERQMDCLHNAPVPPLFLPSGKLGHFFPRLRI
jgi:hypothetical protein